MQTGAGPSFERNVGEEVPGWLGLDCTSTTSPSSANTSSAAPSNANPSRPSSASYEADAERFSLCQGAPPSPSSVATCCSTAADRRCESCGEQLTPGSLPITTSRASACQDAPFSPSSAVTRCSAESADSRCESCGDQLTFGSLPIITSRASASSSASPSSYEDADTERPPRADSPCAAPCTTKGAPLRDGSYGSLVGELSSSFATADFEEGITLEIARWEQSHWVPPVTAGLPHPSLYLFSYSPHPIPNHHHY
jgi:hypothetical protein